MTIKRKILTIGALLFCIFVVLALMNIWTHQQILSNIQIRDEVNDKLAEIEAFAKWKNELIRSVSDIVASKHVPPSYGGIFSFAYKSSSKEGDVLIHSGKKLVALIGEKEKSLADIEHRFDDLRLRINALYYKLDGKIATVLAVAQMDQVLEIDSSEKSSLAPYVLKNLNKITLLAMNVLISRRFSEEDRGVLARNKKFFLSQLHTIDGNGAVTELVGELFREIESLEGIIFHSNQALIRFDSQISKAKSAFDTAASDSEMGAALEKAKAEVKRANEILEKASERTLKTVVVFLFLVPALVILVGILGLNTIIIRPINHLVEAMKNVQAGTFDVRAPVKSSDEIGQLAQAFNAMAAEIKAKVTAMARLNQTLKESESKYRTLVDNLPQSIFLKNKDSVYVSCNFNYANILGIREVDIIGKSDFDFFPEKLAKKYRNDDARILLSEKPEELEESFVLNGKELTVHTVKVPIRDDQGLVSGVLGIFWDITERKQAEEELYLARFFLENAPISTFRIDSDGRIQYVNELACQKFGYQREEFLKLSIWELDPTLSSEKHSQIWTRMEDGAPLHFDSTHRQKNGLDFPVEVFAIQGEYKSVQYTFAFVNDVTERKKLEGQLLQAQKMEAVGTLAGGIAHDFNNILQVINGLTQILLLKKEKDDSDYSTLAAIQNAGSRASELVRQLLLFGRKAETIRRPVQLNMEVEQALGVLKRTIPKMIEIELHLVDQLWLIMADPVQIEQILLNLGTNAADAMPDGGKLVIETANILLQDDPVPGRAWLGSGRYVLLTVSDTGHGMDSGTLEKIYEPFYTTKEFGKGTGLGLASVYGIVKGHGGRISCYSELGQGTTFRIYLPASEPSETASEPEVEEQPLPGGTETILLVDDEESIRSFAEQALTQFGYTILTASSGEEALEIYAQQSKVVDLVILDIGMPGMGGHRCLQKLLKINPQAKVVIASGYSVNGQVSKSMDAGAVGYLTKPYLLSHLLQKARAALDEAPEK